MSDDTLDPINAIEYAEQRKRYALTHVYNAARAVLQLGGQSQQMRALEECCDDYHRLIKPTETTDDTSKST